MSVVFCASSRPVNSSNSTTWPVTGWAVSTSIDLSPEAGLGAEPQPAAHNRRLQMAPCHQKRPSGRFAFGCRVGDTPSRDKINFIREASGECFSGRHAQIETDRSVLLFLSLFLLTSSRQSYLSLAKDTI